MTTAVTPNAENHAGLAPMASRFVDVDGLPWEKTRFEGVEAKTLLVDRASGNVTVLLKMAPGARLPDHEHTLIEQTYVLQGSLVCREGRCGPGEFVWRPAGSRHEASTPDGGLMLAIFQLPNRFFDADGSVTDMLGQDWNEAWSQAANVDQIPAKQAAE